MLTNKNLVLEHPHHGGGVQRLYRFANGFGLSVVNSPILHSFPFAWEVAVCKRMSEDGTDFDLTYDTALTSDVEVFSNDEETNAFIHRAAMELGK